MPPAAPASTRMRWSLAFRLRLDERNAAKPEPIWAIGPSFPADPPLPMVSADAMIFTIGTRLRICPPF